MPMVVQTIYEYVATVRKKDTLFVVFDSSYNDNMRIKYKKIDVPQNSISDNKSREEFLNFMQDYNALKKRDNKF